MIAPKLIRELLDDLDRAVTIRLTPGQWLGPAGHSQDFDDGYRAAQEDAQAWLLRTVLPPLRSIQAWANNEVKVRDLIRRDR